MTTSDTEVSQLIINRLTKTQLASVSSPSTEEIWAVNPEFVGGKLLATDNNGDIVETNATIPTTLHDLTDDTATYPIDQADSVTNQRSGGSAIKTWTGTRAQYNAIVTKDADTIYNITDDTDLTMTLLNVLYPVGSLYIASGNLSTCPLAVLGIGTWTLKAVTTLVTGVNGTAPVIGNGITLGLTDGTNNGGLAKSTSNIGVYTGLYGQPAGTVNSTGAVDHNDYTGYGITTDPTKSGIQANITSTALAVTIWERVA